MTTALQIVQIDSVSPRLAVRRLRRLCRLYPFHCFVIDFPFISNSRLEATDLESSPAADDFATLDRAHVSRSPSARKLFTSSEYQFSRAIIYYSTCCVNVKISGVYSIEWGGQAAEENIFF